MGSYCDLRIGGYTVHSQKYRISNELLSLFVETDKVQGDYAPDRPTTSTDVSEDGDFHGYSSSVAAIADRLDLMGFTVECAKTDFSSLLGQEIEEKLQLAEEWSDKADEDGLYERLRTGNQNEARFLSALTFEAWIDAVRRIKSEGVEWVDYDADHRKSIFSRQLDAIEAHVLNESQDDEHPPLGFYCSDLRFMIRAFLLCAAPSDLVVLDCTDMVHAGYFDGAEPITTHARNSLTAEARCVEKILVLTEGCSDTRLLVETLEVLFPHLRDFLSFLDHEQFSVAGGAGNLLNLLRGFAGAGVSNRVVALFDNDAAGSVQLARAKAIPLPSNFRVLQLPDLDFAETYPTLGPTGLIQANINGSACSLELYLGQTALTQQSGHFVPIQWMGYEKSLGRYQGELVDKHAVQQRYLEALRDRLRGNRKPGTHFRAIASRLPQIVRLMQSNDAQSVYQ